MNVCGVGLDACSENVVFCQCFGISVTALLVRNRRMKFCYGRAFCYNMTFSPRCGIETALYVE